MASFLEDLIGYKTIIVDGVALPRRDLISFEGGLANVADDPVRERTVVTFNGDYSPATPIEFEGEGSDWYVEGSAVPSAGIIRLPAAAEISLVGISIEDMPVTSRRKTLVNIGIEMVTLVHQSDDAPEDARFVLSDEEDIELGPNGAVDVLWCPAVGDSPAGWRVV